MLVLMTRSTESNDVQVVRLIIPSMMMVLARSRAAHITRQRTRSREVARLHGIIYGPTCTQAIPVQLPIPQLSTPLAFPTSLSAGKRTTTPTNSLAQHRISGVAHSVLRGALGFEVGLRPISLLCGDDRYSAFRALSIALHNSVPATSAVPRQAIRAVLPRRKLGSRLLAFAMPTPFQGLTLHTVYATESPPKVNRLRAMLPGEAVTP